MSEGVEQGIVCASYTHARRHPMVLGRIAGWAPPFQLSVTQLAVLVCTFVLLMWTRPVWTAVAPSGLSGLLLLGAPIGLAWAIRRVRVEGRSVPRAAVGWLTLQCQPAGGVASGRPLHERRTVVVRGRVYLAGVER